MLTHPIRPRVPGVCSRYQRYVLRRLRRSPAATLLSPHEHKILAFRMATNATTPQLKVVKALANALASRDLNNAEPILSKNFVAKIFPKVAKLPLELTKEEYLQKYGAVLPMFAQIEVRCIRYIGTTLKPLTDIHEPQAVFNEVIEAPGKVVTHVRLGLHHHLFSVYDA